VSWALAHPESAAVVEAEQLELPVPRAVNGHVRDDPRVAEAVLERLAQVRASEALAAARKDEDDVEVELSFSQLHDFELCPVRYRFSQVWGVPAPPDELLPPYVRAAGSSELGSAVHAALAAWHGDGGDLLALYSGPEAGREMLERYRATRLAGAPTLAVESAFNMRVGMARVRGVVDRVCDYEGRVTLVDFKTNATLDAKLLQAYELQLRIYGLAARRGLVPGGREPRLLLYDLRRGEAREVVADDEVALERIRLAVARIAGGDFRLGPEHDDRPCPLCAYRPICPDKRKVL
jgi:hypothetical protein